jgi:hypothetical protein
MAYITQHIDIDVDIEVDEFVDSCDSREIKELITYLQEQGHLGGEIPAHNMSISDKEWAEVISKIGGRARLQLTTEEEETIRKISNKF